MKKGGSPRPLPRSRCPIRSLAVWILPTQSLVRRSEDRGQECDDERSLLDPDHIESLGAQDKCEESGDDHRSQSSQATLQDRSLLEVHIIPFVSEDGESTLTHYLQSCR